MEFDFLAHFDEKSPLHLFLFTLALDAIFIPVFWWLMHGWLKRFWGAPKENWQRVVTFIVFEIVLLYLISQVLGFTLGLISILIIAALLVHVVWLFNFFYGIYQYRISQNKGFLIYALFSLAVFLIYPYMNGDFTDQLGDELITFEPDWNPNGEFGMNAATAAQLLMSTICKL